MPGRVAGTDVPTHGASLTLMDSPLLVHPAVIPYRSAFELGLEKPDPMRALQSALTIAIFLRSGWIVSGFVKGNFTGNKPFKSAVQAAFIGAIASAAAYCVAKVFRA
ncbi:hypothetical protein SADUNF_Sadunf10G0061300 [Salix dunnii]|uniref:Uncharacterized protein n=1 Tax=Salix dunnii TaxID=1413687 RepID=A0A835JP09_9ROSI|nr:hypothetical protein SADUNF_Sadunf10G0061300 [Salix dunnii]